VKGTYPVYETQMTASTFFSVPCNSGVVKPEETMVGKDRTDAEQVRMQNVFVAKEDRLACACMRVICSMIVQLHNIGSHLPTCSDSVLSRPASLCIPRGVIP
jgi:hypothetical protein